LDDGCELHGTVKLWHDHGNQSSKPMIWLDGLDLPFAIILDSNFFEDFVGGGPMQSRETVPRPERALPDPHRSKTGL